MDFEKSCLNILCIDMKDIYAEFFYFIGKFDLYRTFK